MHVCIVQPISKIHPGSLISNFFLYVTIWNTGKAIKYEYLKINPNDELQGKTFSRLGNYLLVVSYVISQNSNTHGETVFEALFSEK